MGADMRQEGLHAVNDAHQIDRDGPVPVSGLHRAYRAARSYARIVADEMHLAERIDRFLRRPLDGFALRHVAANARRLDLAFLEFGHRHREIVLVDIGEHHIHACLAKGARHRKSNAARPARDEGGLARKILHHAAFATSSMASNSANSLPPFGIASSCARIVSRVCSLEKSA